MRTPPELHPTLAAWVEADRHLELDDMEALPAPDVVLRS